jgi:hypothetical protein
MYRLAFRDCDGYNNNSRPTVSRYHAVWTVHLLFHLTTRFSPFDGTNVTCYLSQVSPPLMQTSHVLDIQFGTGSSQMQSISWEPMLLTRAISTFTMPLLNLGQHNLCRRALSIPLILLLSLTMIPTYSVRTSLPLSTFSNSMFRRILWGRPLFS